MELNKCAEGRIERREGRRKRGREGGRKGARFQGAKALRSQEMEPDFSFQSGNPRRKKYSQGSGVSSHRENTRPS